MSDYFNCSLVQEKSIISNIREARKLFTVYMNNFYEVGIQLKGKLIGWLFTYSPV
jgi:hypothetical protein